MPIFLNVWRLVRQFRRYKTASIVAVVALIWMALLGNALTFYHFDGPLHAEQGEPLSFGDALWYSIISMTTIGYGDYSAQSAGARWGTIIFVVLLGLAAFTTFLGMLVDTFAELTMKSAHGLGEAMMSKHAILVNFPSAARVKHLVEELVSDAEHRATQVVIITDDLERLPFDNPNVVFIRGSEYEPETYQRANLDRADMVMVLATSYDSVHSDASVASAVSVIKKLRPDIYVVAECLSEQHRMLFESVHCDAVVHGSKITDNLLVQEGHDPGVAQMIDEITSNTVGSTVFSTRVDSMDGEPSYIHVARMLLDDDVNLLAINRGEKTYTSFKGLNAAVGDRLIYIAQRRLNWDALREMMKSA